MLPPVPPPPTGRGDHVVPIRKQPAVAAATLQLLDRRQRMRPAAVAATADLDQVWGGEKTMEKLG